MGMQTSAEATAPRALTVTLNDRKRLGITGVEGVDCFNEQIVVLKTPLSTLTVTGAGPNLNQLSAEDGRVSVEGEVDALEYTGGCGRVHAASPVRCGLRPGCGGHLLPGAVHS